MSGGSKVQKQAKYLLMTPTEKIKYLAVKLKNELDLLGIDLTCSAGRETCIDCCIQEIINESNKIKE